MVDNIETVIIGGGQAGLSVSYCLGQLGRENLVLERAAHAGDAWRHQRWDSFTLVIPNWSVRMPGAEYSGPDPDGFMERVEIVSYFERYVQEYRLPIRYNTFVTAVEPRADGGFVVSTAETRLNARNVVMATGLFQTPKIQTCFHSSPSVYQLHSSEYRNPDALPPGGILVAGSGQSGCQIAEELYQAGRQVSMSVGSSGRLPRRYRGKDITRWLYETGFFDRTVDKLPSPRAKFAGAPQISGKDGGHNLNLHQFARDGVVLLGHIQGARDGRIMIAPDLKENLARGDKFETDVVKTVDDYIEKMELDAPREMLPQLRDGYDVPIPSELDLAARGVGTVLWASGYRFDFSMVKSPVFDQDGFPIQRRGVTSEPGLYFVGLPWLDTQKTGLLMGVGEHAGYVASHIAARQEDLR